MTFSLDLSPDVIQVRDWVHEFAAEVIRPAAAEWDEREETPWPIIQEAAKVGLYSLELFAAAGRRAHRAGHADRVRGDVLGRRRHRAVDPGHRPRRRVAGRATAPPNSSASGCPQMFGTADDPKLGVVLLVGARRRLRRRRDPAPARATTRPPTSGCSTAPRPGPPTAASPTCTSSSRRCIPNSAPAGRPRSSSRRTPRASARARSSRSTESARRTPPRWCSTTSGSRAG